MISTDSFFQKLAKYTIGLIFNEWHTRMRGESWPMLPDTILIEDEENGFFNVSTRFDFFPQRYAIVCMLVKRQHYEALWSDAYQKEIAYWDEELFGTEVEDSECSVNQHFILPLYPTGVKFDSLELQVKLLDATIEIYDARDRLIAIDPYPIDTLRRAFSKMTIHGFIPIGGDDYPLIGKAD